MTRIRRALIAADKFKGSLTAAQVAHHLHVGLRRAAPGLEVEAIPVADGGEGTVDAAVTAGFERRAVQVTGPTGKPVSASFALHARTAVVELAEASGLRRLPGGAPAPLTATTYGTGQLIRAALDAGARSIVLGVGGSATTDGGSGMLAALGADFTDADGVPVGPGGGALARVAAVDASRLDPRIARTQIVLASDVDTPLTGPRGAAAVFGPQKGAGPEHIAVLEAALVHYVSVWSACRGPSAARAAEAPGAGAAGGAGFGALVGLGAVRRPGIEVLLDQLGFGQALERVQLVITGEGSLDEQTLYGKAPFGVAQAARRRGLEVVAVCGRVELGPAALATAGFHRVYPLSAVEPDPARCIAQAGPLLEHIGEAIAHDLITTG